jgi:hypothetical protein
MKTRSFRRVGQLLAVAGLMLAVFVPAAAFAQTDYPTTPTSSPCNPTPCTSPETVTVPPGVTVHAVSTSSGGGLAFTGGNIALLVGLGLVAAVGGVVLVRLGRRAHATR